MNGHCPHCGNKLPKPGLPPDVRLPSIKSKIWDAVYNWPGMTAREIIDWIYGHDPSGGPESFNVIAVHVAQMNKLLRQHGIEISFNDGYRVREL